MKSSQLLFLAVSRYRWRRSSPEAGLTLIEVIVSIVIIGITLAAMSPPIVLAVASRTQAARAEQARNLAQAEVDRVRAIMARPQLGIDTLPTLTGFNFPLTSAPSYSDLQLVDVDGDGDNDFGVYRYIGDVECTTTTCATPLNPEQVVAFEFGVLVYSTLADPANFAGDLQLQPASLVPSSGLGQIKQPLAVIYTEVGRGDRRLSLEDYRNLLN